jgi:hypothetical protein
MPTTTSEGAAAVAPPPPVFPAREGFCADPRTLVAETPGRRTTASGPSGFPAHRLPLNPRA